MEKKIVCIIALLGAFCLLGVAGQIGYEDAVMAEKYYCEMVSLYKETSGQSGWPDYKKIYKRACID